MSSKSTIIRMEQLANQLRQDLQIRYTDPVSIHQILKSMKIIGYFRPMEGLSGMAIKVVRNEKDSPYLFMLVNSADGYCKQRFTACHELYHLLFQEKFNVSYDKENIYDTSSIEERNANIFASYLLMPTMGIRQLIPADQQKKDTIRLGTIMMLEQNFRSSHDAMLIQLRDMGIISETYMESMKGNVKSKAMEYGFSTDLYKPTKRTELVGDYNMKARELFDLNLISQAKYFSYLRDMDIYNNTDHGKEESNIG